jgi:hypothetical protein
VTAKNSIGAGEASEINTAGARITKKLPPMESPEIQRKEEKAMTISWVKIPNAVEYELHWSKDGGLKYEKLSILQN